ncbi:MAG: DUF6261 family protein [Fibrobacterota bacterium]
MPVKELSLSLLKHAEVANVAKEVCTTLDTVTDANPFIVRLCTEVKEHITKLENRTGQSVKNMLVAPVAEADEERDRIHRGMVQLVRGMQYHPVDNSLAEAGAKIYNVLQSHNLQLSRESYTVESHLIDALIVDIEKPEYAPAVTAINLKSSIDELKASQQRFAQLHIDKSKVNAELTLTHISKYVNPIRKVLDQLLVALDAAERHELTMYGAAVAHINELITVYNTQARARKTRNQTTAKEVTTSVAAG